MLRNQNFQLLLLTLVDRIGLVRQFHRQLQQNRDHQ